MEIRPWSATMVWRESTSAMSVSSPRYVSILPHAGWNILGRVGSRRFVISTLSCSSRVTGPSYSSLVLFKETPPPLLLEGKQGTAFSHGPPTSIPTHQHP